MAFGARIWDSISLSDIELRGMRAVFRRARAFTKLQRLGVLHQPLRLGRKVVLAAGIDKCSQFTSKAALFRGKKKGKKAQAAVTTDTLDDSAAGVELIDAKDLAKKLDGAKRSFETGLSKIRAGGADPCKKLAMETILDDVEVEAYGEVQPITALGQVQEKGANLLVVSVFDPSQGEAVSDAIRDAGLGLNPSFDGQVVRVPVPKPTKESKQEGIKLAGKLAEAAKVRVRKVRQTALDKIKKAQKASELTEDDARRESKAVEEAVEKVNGGIASALQDKKKQLES